MYDMISKKSYLYLPLLLLILGISLSACGGSSQGAPAESNQSNDWDNMRWDQGSWN